VATVVFNAASGWPKNGDAGWGDIIEAAAHATMPGLVVVITEALRRAIARRARIVDGRAFEPLGMARWLLAPFQTFAMWRREVRGFQESRSWSTSNPDDSSLSPGVAVRVQVPCSSGPCSGFRVEDFRLAQLVVGPGVPLTDARRGLSRCSRAGRPGRAAGRGITMR
jgi:Protein of unknown function (DUF2637)